MTLRRASAIDDLVPVMELLHSAQERSGYITEDDVLQIAEVAMISPAELYGAITAYPRFRLAAGPTADAVCMGPACRLRGADAARTANYNGEETHCLGLCDQPLAVLGGSGAHIADAVNVLQTSTPEMRVPTIGVAESVFFADGDPFEAVRTARKLAPDEVISIIGESGLQGRGGAGFPTGAKWSAVKAASGERKFIVCNADESEPGSFKDRHILDNQPRRLLAGMTIAAHAVGADAGVIYIRAEYRSQYEGLLREIERLRDEGWLGDAFDIVVRRGAGLYVCGEETALLNSLEGRRPIPRDRPPYPTTSGLLGQPTVVQNVETLSAVPAIIDHGAAWYREAGSPKLYCVSGDVSRAGNFELPMTTTVRELLEQAGADLDRTKAFTIGGLSGGMLPASKLDLRLDFATPREHDAFLGSGCLVAISDSRCMVRFTYESVRFFAGESCGKCFPCRIGTTRLKEYLGRGVRFQPVEEGDLREISQIIGSGAACGLGPAAGLVTRHLLDHFSDEFRAHTREGRCPTGECERT
jgi:NADH:ubiquinone oxidoreductase subunit F (NADH-binding)